MQRLLSLFIAFRYTRTKKRNGFISFISLASMIGIALGVMVLITVLSVMNGFDEHIREGIFSLAPQVTVSGLNNKLSHWQQLESKLAEQPNIVATAPFISGQGILRSGDTVQPTLVVGIEPKQEAKLTQLGKMISMGKLDDLKKGSFGIVLGDTLADNLGAILGSKVTLITPQVSITPAGITPRFKRFTVVGIFHTGSGFGFDSRFAYINLHDAQTMFMYGNAVSGINLKLPDPYMALDVTHQLLKVLPNAYVSNWTLRYGPFFKAIALEKTMMFLILLLIVAVAAFNLVSTLVMVVNDKQSDIAILRTLGATPGLIMRVFMLQGMIVGFIGTFVGLVLGVLLALNVTAIVNFIQRILHVQLFQSSVYYVAYLPSKLQVSDVMQICVIALLLCLLATIYPAWRASRTQPAEALRYE